MKQIFFGERTGLRVSNVALGTARIGRDAHGALDAAEADRVLAAFADAGGTLFDSSSAYQQGASEEALGRFLRDAGRERFVVVSKYGRTTGKVASAASVGSHRRALHEEIDGTLRRLGTDRVDVYLAHFDDGLTPVEEIARGFDEIVRAGKALYVGLSNFSAWRAATATTLADERGWAPVSALQLRYNLLQRDAEREHLPFAAARGLATMAYSPLAGGALGRTTTVDGSPRETNIRTALGDVARSTTQTPVAVALAWLRAQGTIPVLGPRTVEHLQGSLAGADLALAPEHLAKLDAASRVAFTDPCDMLDDFRDSVGIVSPRRGRVL